MIKQPFKFFKSPGGRAALSVIGILLLLLTLIVSVWHGKSNSMEATLARSAQIYFDGDYRIGDGEWQRIVKGEHITSTQGDVTLRGNFHILTPDGEYIGIYSGSSFIAFYTDHISLTFYDANGGAYMLDHENPLFGKYACGVDWTFHSFNNLNGPIEIVIHNPHSFGNENAIDEMLSRVAFWSTMEFEKGILDSESLLTNTGLLFVIVSIMFLGTALFSSLIHIKNSKVIWLLGAIVFFAGAYFICNTVAIPFLSESVFLNTTAMGASMMLYMFFLSVLISASFKKAKNIGVITSICLGFANAAFFILPAVSDLLFYDTWLWWVIVQSIANVVLLICLVIELIPASFKEKLVYGGAVLPLIAFETDAVATWLGVWEGGLVSRFVFIILFIAATIVVLRIIPKSINALVRAKEAEAERLLLNTQLAESRISTMMSQIRPHFIYNTLGSIEQLCELDPQKAGELVHGFAKYLRGNFRELDNRKPIRISQEIEHVNYYMNIETVRFPDIAFEFEMNSVDFSIPAFTIQPLVENAVKHGLLKSKNGGTIRVVSFETDTHYCVSVVDDGVGFDTSVLIDEEQHVGIRNIRGRLAAMVDGTLEIESSEGVGTKALITIPKEVRK